MIKIVIACLLCAIQAYLLGSLSFSIIVSKLMFHQDIRTFGSGNAGMTNVLRTFGKKAAAITIVGDIGKGVAAVLLAKLLFGTITGLDGVYGAYIAAFCAVLGHLYPVYFKFKGGKGVSVAAGTILAIQPPLFPVLLAIFLVVFFISKMVSLSSISAAVAYPVITYFYALKTGLSPLVTTVLAAVMGGLVIFMHRSNIGRIKNGTEYKFFQKKPEESGKNSDDPFQK
ncbi:MAG: glycerol-3-phosphate 1-O-acyltransferase PlsY [Oscillospiraceae bacterium]|nr:glycerol-3-phosphate 1-O-acyltransferase PlsY [Oscillospiraceae bacterium]